MQKGQTGILILVGILIIVGVAGGAYYLGKSSTLKLSSAPVAPYQAPQPTPPTSSDANREPSGSAVSPKPSGAGEIANWKTYTNKDYKFLIKYPSNMVYEEPVNDTYLLLVAFRDPTIPIWSDYFTLEVVKSKNLEDEIEYRRWQIVGHVADSMKKESRITVRGYEGARLEYEIATSDPNSKKDFIIVIIKSEKYNYVIQANSELIDKIVSSFQILK